MPAKNLDHVLAHDGSQGFFGFSCAHCRQKQAMPSPCIVEIVIAANRVFATLHADCKPREVANAPEG